MSEKFFKPLNELVEGDIALYRVFDTEPIKTGKMIEHADGRKVPEVIWNRIRLDRHMMELYARSLKVDEIKLIAERHFNIGALALILDALSKAGNDVSGFQVHISADSDPYAEVVINIAGLDVEKLLNLNRRVEVQSINEVTE